MCSQIPLNGHPLNTDTLLLVSSVSVLTGLTLLRNFFLKVLQSNPVTSVNTDTEGIIEGMRINGCFVLSGLHLEKIKRFYFPRDRQTSKLSVIMRCSFQAGVCKAGFYCNFFFEIIFEAKFFHFIRFWCTFLIGRWGSWAIFSFLFFLKNFVALALPVFLTNAILLNKRPSPPFSGKTKTLTLLFPYTFFCIVPHLFYCQILTGISTGSPDFMEFLGLELYENEQTTFLIPQLRL